MFFDKRRDVRLGLLPKRRYFGGKEKSQEGCEEGQEAGSQEEISRSKHQPWLLPDSACRKRPHQSQAAAVVSSLSMEERQHHVGSTPRHGAVLPIFMRHEAKACGQY
ncbi:MAG: hypothetical protein ACUVXJ_12880 [Phycisphaerae bacterium]